MAPGSRDGDAMRRDRTSPPWRPPPGEPSPPEHERSPRVGVSFGTGATPGPTSGSGPSAWQREPTPTIAGNDWDKPARDHAARYFGPWVGTDDPRSRADGYTSLPADRARAIDLRRPSDPNVTEAGHSLWPSLLDPVDDEAPDWRLLERRRGRWSRLQREQRGL